MIQTVFKKGLRKKKAERPKKKRDRSAPRGKNRRRGAVILCACAAALFMLAINLVVVRAAAPLIMTAEEAGALMDEEGPADCILVLGASVTQHGPSPMLANRLDTGLDLFGMGVSNIMLLSGDNGQVEYNEVQAMKEYALENGGEAGLEAANIYLDYAGFSTYSSAIRCKEVFQAERVVIVTQRYHLYRAIYNAKLVGLDAVGVAAEDGKSSQLPRDLREILARVKDFFLTHIGYTPKIMGDPVPLDYPSTQG